MSIDPASARPPSEGGLPSDGENGHTNGTSTPQLTVDSATSSGTGTPIGFQRFPHNKHLDHVVRTPGRQPSPQPLHLGLPGQHRVLHEEGSGYISAKFEGKQEQMEQGKISSQSIHIHNALLILETMQSWIVWRRKASSPAISLFPRLPGSITCWESTTCTFRLSLSSP